ALWSLCVPPFGARRVPLCHRSYLLRRRPHSKAARRHHDHLGAAVVAVAEGLALLRYAPCCLLIGLALCIQCGGALALSIGCGSCPSFLIGLLLRRFLGFRLLPRFLLSFAVRFCRGSGSRLFVGLAQFC